MRSRSTVVLAALAAVLAVVLVVVLLQRPSGPTTVNAPPTPQPTPTAAVTPTPTSATPSSAVTDPAQEGGPSSSLPTSEVDNGDATPGATPYAQTSAARREWQPVATGFGKAFTDTKGKKAKAWRQSLQPFVTAAVFKQLTDVDLADVPDGTFATLEPGDFGEDKVSVLLQYDSGLTLAVYLQLGGDGWRVYAYDRQES